MPPQDLIELRNAFVRADASCIALAAEMPSGLAIVRGTATVDPRLRTRSDRADDVRADIVDRMYGHPWWGTVDNRFAAEQELRKAARDQFDV